MNRPDPADPVDVLAKVGGLEIAALTGVFLGAAAHRVPVVMDGFISAAAALAAVRLCHECVDYILPSHVSIEVGHQVVLEELGMVPLFDLEMRLGEGTGAALAMSVIEASARILAEMATFESAGVAGDPSEADADSSAEGGGSGVNSRSGGDFNWGDESSSRRGQEVRRGASDRAVVPESLHRTGAEGTPPPPQEPPPRSRAATEARRLTLAVTFLTSLPLRVEGDGEPRRLWGQHGAGTRSSAWPWAPPPGACSRRPRGCSGRWPRPSSSCFSRPSRAACTWTASWTPATASSAARRANAPWRS